MFIERFAGFKTFAHNRVKALNVTINEKNATIQTLEADVERFKQEVNEWQDK